jgi:hypothetical protein
MRSSCKLSITGLLLVFALCSTVAFAQTNIEKNFTTANNIDLTGNYAVSGYLEDSSEYEGTLKLTKFNTYTTPMGNVLQSFKMVYDFGDTKIIGVGVFDGHRLYYACGAGDNKNYYLLLLSKAELATAEFIALQDYQLKNMAANEGQYFEWKGDPPWYGYISPKVESYGYWFWIDGLWGQYSVHSSNGFPHAGDTASYFMLELKKNGKFGKKMPFVFPEGYWKSGAFMTTPMGENHRVDVGKTWGGGMLVPDPITGDTILVAMIGGPNDSYVGYLDISGHQFLGTWAINGGDFQRSEVWEVPEDVIKKNPAWFK